MDRSIYSKEHRYIIKRLRKARQESELSQGEVARVLGKTQSYVSKIESGQRRISVVQLTEFAKIYRKKINFFIK